MKAAQEDSRYVVDQSFTGSEWFGNQLELETVYGTILPDAPHFA